jgi:SAM-dependent methyltransferase
VPEAIYCPFCGAMVAGFQPAGHDFEVLRAKQVIGGGRRPNARCPNCGSSDRERLLRCYLDTIPDMFDRPIALLHVAPEKCLGRMLRRMPNVCYVAGDLRFRPRLLQFDLTHLPFDDQAFDIVICNHVLEHVADDAEAIAELYRVVKFGGFAILQVPVSATSPTTHEDAAICTPELRALTFGQEDHVRLYGRDYPSRLENGGFEVELVDVRDRLGQSCIDYYGLIPGELVHIARRRGRRTTDNLAS